MRGRVPLAILGLVAALYVAALLAQPAPLDWRPDYRHGSARPLGARVLFELLPRGSGDSVAVVDRPPYLHLADTALVGTTYLFVTDAFAPGRAEADRLLAYAARGNTVFVAAESFAGPLADTFRVPTPGPDGYREPFDTWWEGPVDSTLHFATPALGRPGGYRFPLEVETWAMDGLDPTRATALGLRADSLVTLARVRVGAGGFVLSSTPLAFSNAALVGDGDGAGYLAGVLGYLPAGPVFWDAHYKPGADASPSPLRHVLRQPALRWAYFLSLVGLAAFVLFRGRRWQRPIPVVAPPPNATAEFVRTVGRLYHQHGDHKALVGRKERFFLDRLRTRLHVENADLSEATERRVVQRAGVPPEVAAAVFASFRRLRASPRLGPAGVGVTAADVLALERALERFFRAAERG